MISRVLKLETFAPSDPDLTRDNVTDTEAEEVRLAAYEQGYSAGWEDAVAAQDADLTRLRNELGQNLQDLAFTYHEAHSHVLRTLEPLLRDMVAKVLPAIARETLGHMVVEELRPLVADLTGAPLTIATHPDNVAMIEDLVIARAKFPAELRADPTLGPGQAQFRIGPAERVVDLDGVIAAIAGAVAGFFDIEKQELKSHG